MFVFKFNLLFIVDVCDGLVYYLNLFMVILSVCGLFENSFMIELEEMLGLNLYKGVG